MNNWKDDKSWSDRFIPEIKSILGGILIGEPKVEEDMERNTDLIVLRMDPVRIACRVRRNKFRNCRNDFTIRAGRPSGVKVELTKILEGWGDYYFYGIADEDDSGLLYWFVGELNAFRIWHNRQVTRNNGDLPGIPIDNTDGSSFFYLYKDMADNIPNFLVASNNLRIVS